MTNGKWIHAVKAGVAGRAISESRKGPGPSRSPTLSSPDPRFHLAWPGHGACRAGVGLRAQPSGRLVDPQRLADQPALSLDDPAHESRSFSGMGPARCAPRQGLGADRAGNPVCFS